MVDAESALTPKEGYRAMLYFLEAYFERTKAEEIAALLGGLAFNKDGLTMDPAAWQDWLDAVEQTRA